MTTNIRRKAQAKSNQANGTNRLNRPDDLLAGRCFLILEPDGVVQYQGFIRGRVEPGFYLVQYFEAFMGTPNDMKVVSMETIMGWRLEEDDEMLRHQLEYGFLGARSERAFQARDAKRKEEEEEAVTQGYVPTDAEVAQAMQDAGDALAELDARSRP